MARRRGRHPLLEAGEGNRKLDEYLKKEESPEKHEDTEFVEGLAFDQIKNISLKRQKPALRLKK